MFEYSCGYSAIEKVMKGSSVLVDNGQQYTNTCTCFGDSIDDPPVSASFIKVGGESMVTTLLINVGVKLSSFINFFGKRSPSKTSNKNLKTVIISNYMYRNLPFFRC